MATAVNPKIVSAPGYTSLPLEKIAAGTSKTWKQGEFLTLSSGLAQAAATGDIPRYIAAEDQSTATSAGDTVWAYRLEEGMILEMYVVDTTAAAAETAAVIGTSYDLYVASNKHYVEVNASTDKVFRILKHGSDYNSAQFTSTQTPGVVQVVLQNIGV